MTNSNGIMILLWFCVIVTIMYVELLYYYYDIVHGIMIEEKNDH